LAGRRLYEALSEPAPASGAPGETALTAAKRTLDNDQEAEHTIILLDGY
jgi:hypothetical protein